MNEPPQENPEEIETFAGLKIEDPPDDLTDIGTSIILLGPAGCGKTTLAASCAEYEGGQPTLFFDAEGGTKVLAGMDKNKVRRMSVKTWAQCERFRRQCIREANNLPWRTIVFDNLTALCDLALGDIVGFDDAPSQPKWGDINRQIIQFVQTFRDIARDNPVNVIFVAWDAPDKQDDTGKWKKNIVLTPQLQNKIPGMIDIIGHVTVLDNYPTYTRVLSFAPSPRSIGKFRKALDSPAQEIPHEIFYGVRDMPMPAILATLKEGKPWPKGKYLPPSTKKTE